MMRGDEKDHRSQIEQDTDAARDAYTAARDLTVYNNYVPPRGAGQESAPGELFSSDVAQLGDEKRYQIFVSSTSIDLANERRMVIDALLEASYIPVGMELFNAATESAWPVIERLIDNCDYYVVIVAGRYGTERPDGKSFTQSEYEYAKRTKKPRLAFLHSAPEDLPRRLTEPTEAGMKKVRRFRRMLQEDLLCKSWSRSGDELAGKVVSSLNSAVLTHPQPGWVRGDSLRSVPAMLRANLIAPAQAAGIVRISPDGQAGPVMSERIGRAHHIAIMSTSATRVIEIQKTYLVEALSAGCAVRLLVPELQSPFLQDVEQSESEDAYREPISDEIVKVRRRLREAVGEASRLASRRQGSAAVGSVQVGYFTTHLRSTMILCDDQWGWLTLTLPPARAPQTPSFELSNTGQQHTLLEACLRHFDRTWTIVAERGKVDHITEASKF
jgi:Domain of unknown function (DUF4062)